MYLSYRFIVFIAKEIKELITFANCFRKHIQKQI